MFVGSGVERDESGGGRIDEARAKREQADTGVEPHGRGGEADEKQADRGDYKAAAKDAKKGKATLVSALGVDASRKRLATLVAEAETALAPFGERGGMLRACARYIAERKK